MNIVRPNRASRSYTQCLVGAPAAVISYAHTSLGAAGEGFVASFTVDCYFK